MISVFLVLSLFNFISILLLEELLPCHEVVDHNDCRRCYLGACVHHVVIHVLLQPLAVTVDDNCAESNDKLVYDKSDNAQNEEYRKFSFAIQISSGALSPPIASRIIFMSLPPYRILNDYS